MKYQLFDTESGKLVGQYPTETDADRVVLASYDKYGSQWTSDLALHERAFGLQARNGARVASGRVIAEGEELIALARSRLG